MTGVFQIDREIFDNDIWNNIIEFRIFFYIVGNAVWKEEGKDIGNVHVKRGQYLRSYRNIRKDLMYMENNAVKYYGLATIKRTVDKLVEDGRIETEETELGTLFTAVNYSLYQGFDRFNNNSLEQQRNSNGTATEQQRNNKKKDKKVKKVEEDIYILTEDEKLFLGTLNKIEKYPLDRKKDLEMFRTLGERYKELNLLEAIEDWRQYKLDKPLKENSNARSQINTSFKNYIKWGKCLKKGDNNGRGTGKNEGKNEKDDSAARAGVISL